MSESYGRDIFELWREQKLEPLIVAAEELRQRASNFQRIVQRRNLREYVAGVAVIAFFCYRLPRENDPLIVAATAMSAAGVMFVMAYLWRYGAARDEPGAAGAKTCAAFLREEMERQKVLLERVSIWYLGPFLPGLIIFCIAVARKSGAAALAFAAAVAGIFTGIGWLNWRAAKKLSREIEELKKMETTCSE